MVKLEGIFFVFSLYLFVTMGWAENVYGREMVTYSEAISSYSEAIKNNDNESIQKALDLFNQLIAANPDEDRALVYKGSLLTKLAKISWMPWNKISYLNDGIDLMDNGIDRMLSKKIDTRREFEVRMVRGITSARIPSIFKRGHTAVADFKAIRENTNFTKMTKIHQATVLAFSAILSYRAGQKNEAEGFLKQSQGLDSHTAETIWAER